MNLKEWLQNAPSVEELTQAMNDTRARIAAAQKYLVLLEGAMAASSIPKQEEEPPQPTQPKRPSCFGDIGEWAPECEFEAKCPSFEECASTVAEHQAGS